MLGRIYAVSKQSCTHSKHLKVRPSSIDGRTDLGMVVYNPATPGDAEKTSSQIGSTARREEI
jgi:hypothetical protein